MQRTSKAIARALNQKKMSEKFDAAHAHPIDGFSAIIAWNYMCSECSEVIILYQDFYKFGTTETRVRGTCPFCHSQKEMLLDIFQSYIFRGTIGARERAN